ncbi:MAG: carboxypeptidase regulatory-like domain-containing protein [Anaerolineales bacterium]|nr:carboxypeptidase regulatory-like domain-containing protein [Anaerolineales bacterium]MCL4259318.1 carboxypeptidase regulatory-like domain-containing protein [Anaerolineales bacterium]
MFIKRISAHSVSRRGSRLSLIVGLGVLYLLLAGCAGEDVPVSNDDVVTPAAQSERTQVSGIVTDLDGNPLAEAGIAVTKSVVGVPEILILSGEDGRYTWHLPAGTFTLSAMKEGYKELSLEVVVKEGETTKLDFKLEKLP